MTKRCSTVVTGVREAVHSDAYRRGHTFGNRLLSGFLSRLFGGNSSDILSGYRTFSRRFVKSFPVLSSDFEVETELGVHALELSLPVDEFKTPYRERPEGSFSKPNTYRDGARILITMLRLFSAGRPFAFYSPLSVVLALLAFVLATPLVITYLQTGLVRRFPTAILVTGPMLLGALSFSVGLILDTVTRCRREVKMLHYLEKAAARP